MTIAKNEKNLEHSSQILLIDDDTAICDLVSKYLQHHGHSVDILHGHTGLDSALSKPYDAVLLDVTLPGQDGFFILDRITKERPGLAVVMLTALSGVDSVVQAMRGGAFDYLPKPLDMQRLQIAVRNATDRTRLKHERDGLRAAMIRQDGGPDLVCASQTMTEVISLIERVAGSQVPVLLHGEPGCGKEIVARRLHARSRQSDGPFVCVNCNALTMESVDRELFGENEEAPNAEVASGSLFLDEVGELNSELQSRLLRLLQSRQSGSRIIAATSRHLPSEVSRGKFRADLFYRLNVFSITVPPLRDRREDVEALTRYSISQFSAREMQAPPKVTDEALDLLKNYEWPGNIRELNNIIERSALLCTGGVIRPSDLPRNVQEARRATTDHFEHNSFGQGPGYNDSIIRPLRDLEREMMVTALKETRGNVSEAARRLGIGRATFYRRAQRHSLTREEGFLG